MATAVHLARKSGTPKMADLQADASLAAVAVELAPLLSSKPLALVTGSDVAAALEPNHPGTTPENDPVNYMWYWDDHIQEWVRQCLLTVVVTVPQGAGVDPIVVRVEDRAQYV
jgi:hypothetical protein